MTQKLDELLKFCTVKISIPGQRGWGTGFLVAPGLILTCAHVVEGVKLGSKVQISIQGRKSFSEATLNSLPPDYDLALLSFSPSPIDNSFCVYLAPEFEPFDRLYTFGYSDQFPDGTSVTSECEGTAFEKGQSLILFKSGQIRPGISGSPLLNKRTGSVCGIIKFTRDRTTDLGGGAIPTQEILEQFPQLKELQQEFHQQDHRWWTRLPSIPTEETWREACGVQLRSRQQIVTNVFGKPLNLDDIHVPLGLLEYQWKLRIPKDISISPKRGAQVFRLELQQQQTEKITPISYKDFFQKVLAQQKSPQSQGRRLAIIGEAGSGKTVQLLKIAEWVLNNTNDLPILIPLSEVREKSLRDYLSEDWLLLASKTLGQVSSEWTIDLEQRLTAGQVWLLMDGVDEMSGADPLLRLAQEFRENQLLSKARIVLTCRLNLWDKADHLRSEFDTYKMLDFSYGDEQHPDQVRQFIEKWFVDSSDPEKGRKLRNILDESGKERIKDLVRNPLRLGLLCFHWQGDQTGTLLDVYTKAQLYKLFVKDFYKWKDNQLQEKILPKSTTKREQLIEQLNDNLGKLAKEAIDLGFKSLLPHDLVERVLVKSAPKDREFDLFELILKIGWLNKVGADQQNPLDNVYAFFHPSFQEYFAAKAIEDWHFFLNHNPKHPSQGTYRIFEPQWKEVILLWFGRGRDDDDIFNKKKQEFITAMLRLKDGCTTYLFGLLPIQGFYEYRAHFIAAAAIAEFRNCNSGNKDKIVNRLIDWACPLFYQEINTSLRKAASDVIQETDRGTAITKLRSSVRNRIGPHSRLHAIKNLWRINHDSSFATTEILQIIKPIERTPKKSIKDYLDLFIDELFTGDIFGECLDKLAEIDLNVAVQEYFEMRRYFIDYKYSLSHILNVNKSICIDDSETIRTITYLLESIEGDESSDQISYENKSRVNNLYPDYKEVIRRDIASALDKISLGNLTAIAELERILKSSQKWETHIIAASSLCKIDPGNLKAMTALENFLDEAENLLKAALSIEKIKFNDSDAIVQDSSIISKNISLLETFLRESPWGRWSSWENLLVASPAAKKAGYLILAAYSFGKASPSNPKAAIALENIIYASEIRDKVYNILSSIDPNNPTLHSSQFELENRYPTKFQTCKCPEILKSVKALPLLMENSSEATHLMSFFFSIDLTMVAIRILEKIAPNSSKTIPRLFEILHFHFNHYGNTAEECDIISKICIENHEALTQLWNLLEYVIRHNYTPSYENNSLKVNRLQWRFEKEHNIELLKSFKKIYSGDYEYVEKVVVKFNKIKIDFIRNRQAICSDITERFDDDFRLSSWTRQNLFIINVFALFLALRLRKIELGEPTAIEALAQLVKQITHYKKYQEVSHYGILSEVAKTLGKIGTNSSSAVNTLIHILDIEKTKFPDVTEIDILGKIGADNPLAISALVKIFRTKDERRQEAIESLKKVLQRDLVTGITELRGDLKGFWRYGPCYNFMWYCAQNVPYPEFYQAWHKPKPLSFAQRITKLAFWSVLALLLIG